jgi:hypothetical protein
MIHVKQHSCHSQLRVRRAQPSGERRPETGPGPGHSRSMPPGLRRGRNTRRGRVGGWTGAVSRSINTLRAGAGAGAYYCAPGRVGSMGAARIGQSRAGRARQSRARAVAGPGCCPGVPSELTDCSCLTGPSPGAWRLPDNYRDVASSLFWPPQCGIAVVQAGVPGTLRAAPWMLTPEQAHSWPLSTALPE